MDYENVVEDSGNENAVGNSEHNSSNDYLIYVDVRSPDDHEIEEQEEDEAGRFSNICEDNEPSAINSVLSDNQGTTEENERPNPQQASGPKAPKKASPEFVCVKLTDILPNEVPEIILQSHDDFVEMLTTTMNKKLSYTYKAVAVDELDLTFPQAYADKLQSNQELAQTILAQILVKISSAKQLCLPTLPVKVLHSLLVSDNSLKEQQFDKIVIKFSDKDEKSVTTKLLEITKALIRQRIKTIVYEPTEIPAYIRAKTNELKKELKKLIGEEEEIKVIYDGLNIKKGRNVSTRAGEKRPSESNISNISKKINKKQSSICQKLQPLPKYTITNEEIFSFDSGGFIQIASDFSFTPYDYWQLDIIHQFYTGQGMTLAVVDTGIDLSHPAFNIEVQDISAFNIEFKDFTGDLLKTDSDDHGTLCAGIACGKSFKYLDPPEFNIWKTFPQGVAPKSTLVVCKVTRDTDKASLDAITAALRWLKEKKVDVVSLSLGTRFFFSKIAQAITELVYDNVVVVCAASNEGQKFSQPICFPARLGHVLCIGSHGPHGKPSAFSPVGQDIDFLAPGEGVAGPSSSFYSRHVRVDNGTSYAAPAVAGLICLIFELITQRYPGEFHHFKNPWIVKELLREISTSPGSHSSDRGYGSLNPLPFFQNPFGVLNKIFIEVILPSI